MDWYIEIRKKLENVGEDLEDLEKGLIKEVAKLTLLNVCKLLKEYDPTEDDFYFKLRDLGKEYGLDLLEYDEFQSD